MTEPPSLVPTIYAGWQAYQGLLTAALAPLSPEQLTLRAAPGLRSIGEIAVHMIGARARWFHLPPLREGGAELAALGRWDRRGMPARTAPELVQGLETTWLGMQAPINRWTSADWQQTFPGEPTEDPPTLTRQWIIWHLIEHDLHHGGEISLTLGVHALTAPAL